MASKTWQKTFKWTVHYQEECLWSIFTSSIYCFQYRPECRLPYLVVGCRSCPCNLLRANMNNTQLRYRVRIIWNGVNINTVLQNLVKLDRIEKANCIFEWDPANLQPGQSIVIASTSQIKIHKQKESYLSFSFKSTNQQLDSQQIFIRWLECTKIHRVQKRSLWCKSTANQISSSPFYLS